MVMAYHLYALQRRSKQQESVSKKSTEGIVGELKGIQTIE